MAATRSKDNRPGIASRMGERMEKCAPRRGLTVRRGRRCGLCRLDGLECQIHPHSLQIGAERRVSLGCDPELELEAACRLHPPPTDVPRVIEALRLSVQIAGRAAPRVR